MHPKQMRYKSYSLNLHSIRPVTLALEREDEPNQTYFERNELDDVEAYDEDLHSDAEFDSTPTESVSVGLGKGDLYISTGSR